MGLAVPSAVFALSLIALASAVSVPGLGFGFVRHHAAEPYRHRREGLPWFCDGLDCPSFTVDVNETKYVRERSGDATAEVRSYGPTTWLSTNVRQAKKLFAYIQGENSAHVQIPMTAPVIVDVTLEGTDLLSKKNVLLKFYGSEQSKPLPKPLDADLLIEDEPPTTYLVISAATQMNTWTALALYERMKKVLLQSGVKTVEGEWRIMAYNSPFFVPSNVQAYHTELAVVLLDK